jgi:hypothetical protein
LYSNTNICFLPYKYIWYSYSVKLTLQIYIRCIFCMGLLDIRHIFGIYSNIRHRISIIQIWIFFFIGTNIFDIRIWSKSELWIYSYSVRNLIFVLHWYNLDFLNNIVDFHSQDCETLDCKEFNCIKQTERYIELHILSIIHFLPAWIKLSSFKFIHKTHREWCKIKYGKSYHQTLLKSL